MLLAPAEPEYVPAPHSAQAVALVADQEPARQILHALSSVAPAAVADLPAAQAAQLAAPGAAHVPGAHCLHVSMVLALVAPDA